MKACDRSERDERDERGRRREGKGRKEGRREGEAVQGEWKGRDGLGKSGNAERGGRRVCGKRAGGL